MVEKKLGHSCDTHCFGARGNNYPFTKAMVDHDHDRIEAIDWGEVSDEINGEVLEGAGALEGKGGDGWDHRMGEDLVHLANHASRNIFPDISEKAWPPVVLGKEGDGAKMEVLMVCKNLHRERRA